MTTKLEPSSDNYSFDHCVTLTGKKMQKVKLHNRAAVTLIALAAKRADLPDISSFPSPSPERQSNRSSTDSNHHPLTLPGIQTS